MSETDRGRAWKRGYVDGISSVIVVAEVLQSSEHGITVPALVAALRESSEMLEQQWDVYSQAPGA